MKLRFLILSLLFPLFLIAQENGPLICADGIDNDGDGLIDCEDDECLSLPNDGCNFCPGAISFGDVLIEHIPGCDNLSDIDDAQSVLGLSDNPLGVSGDLDQALFLGEGGIVKIGFTDNLLINSGDSQEDLWVFEVGTVVEAQIISARPADAFTLTEVQNAGLPDVNGDGFFEVGTIAGATSGLDLDAVLPGYANSMLKFDAVEILDVEGQGDSCAVNTPGADIDAVCALFTQAVDCAGTVNGNFEIDECGECLDPDDPEFNNCSDCLDGNPGTLSGGGLLCASETLSITTNGDGAISAGQSLVYFISTSAAPSEDTIIGTSTDGSFDPVDPIYAGLDLYVFAGLVDETGVINFDEECEAISPAVSVVWLEEVVIVPINNCDGVTGELSVQIEILGGLPAYDGSLFTVSNIADLEAPVGEPFIIGLGIFEGLSYSIGAVDANGCSAFFVSDPSACVKNAIALSHFEGKVQEDGNLLHWRTETELGNDHFVLQRSAEQSEWENITVIDGAGTSTTPIDYHFLDVELNEAVYYYRLLSIDFNGQGDFSPVVYLERLSEVNTDLSISPNPVVTNFTVETVGFDSSAQMSIFNVEGKMLYQKRLSIDEVQVTVSGQDFPSGLYFLQISDTDRNEVLKFVKE